MDFPKEMIEELLMRMPLKSIIKFKCVSKYWNNFISTTNFRKCYQSRCGNTSPSGFLYHKLNSNFFRGNTPTMLAEGPAKFMNTSNIEREELSSLDGLQKFGFIIGSSKGLLLLSSNPMSYYVYDLLTKKHFQLPKPHKKSGYVCTGFMCEDREQNCPKNINSGSSCLTYKVVRIATPHILNVPKTTYKVETYSSETGKWRKSVMTCARWFYLCNQRSAKVLGGRFYWENKDTMGGIIVYNPDDAAVEAKCIEYPQRLDAHLIYGYTSFTGTEDGCLLCTCAVACYIDVWALGNKYGAKSNLDDKFIDQTQWTLIHRIRLLELGFRPRDEGYPHRYSTIDIHPHDSNVIFLETDNEIVSYNLNTKGAETLLSKEEEQKPFMNAATYIPFEFPFWPCL